MLNVSELYQPDGHVAGVLRQRSETMSTPSLFPCADKVKVPQIGSEETRLSLDLKVQRTPLAPMPITTRSSLSKQKNYLQRISSDLAFEEDVVKDRCFHMLPYDEKYLYEALDPTGLVPLPPRMKIPPGRHNARKSDVRHMPCNLTISKKPHLKPLKRRIMERAMEMHKDSLRKAMHDEQLQYEAELGGGAAGFFLTELKQDQKQKQETKDASKKISLPKVVEKEEPATKKVLETTTSKSKQGVKKEDKEETNKDEQVAAPSPTKSMSSEKSEKKKIVDFPDRRQLQPEDYDWDGFVLSNLSHSTADWLVYEKMTNVEDKERIQMMMEEWYGKPDPGQIFKQEYEEAMAAKEDTAEKKPKKKWRKREASLLSKVYDSEQQDDIKPHAFDPYSEENNAPFYRQPAGLRRIRKKADMEDAGAINATANITIKTYTPPPLPTIRDFVNPEVGENLFVTDNEFEQEWLTGAEQIHELDGDKMKIKMSTANTYKKQLQNEYPAPPEEWFPETDREKEEDKVTPRLKKVTKGLKRWKDLPKTANETEDRVVPPGYDPEFHRSPDPMTRRATKNNQALMQVIDEWRSKWHLTGQLADSNPNDLIKDMADIQVHVRLKAIATIAKAAEMQETNKENGLLGAVDNQYNFPLGSGNMPERLYVALECLLNDSVPRVQIAAAITLYSLNRPVDQAKSILHNALTSENNVDRWAAAQCLSHFGVCNSLVVGEIINQLLTTEDTIKHERAIYLLGKLSIFSPLVHGMVAEQLNSSSWRHKVIACKILPTLHGTINKDITNKLSDLMWNDWHEDVKKAAAQCLGKTSHGRDVHEKLRHNLLSTDEMTKIEAINKTGQLGIMTAKLLPSFLKCFNDEYVSVRSEVCITCGNLEIKDEQVMENLIKLATFDPIWKVKALAIQAMGKIGVVNEEITETLLWAVRYEENAGVRAEACHTLMLLELKTSEVAEVLQERFLVESSPLVRDEIAATLKMFGISATEDMDMVAQIKNEVRKLCTRNNIAAQITLNEKDDRKRENLARLIYKTQQELEESEPEQEPMMQRIRSMSQASSRSSTPHPRAAMDTDRTTESAMSPAPSREGAFTPSADEELEKILSRAESSRTSPETTASTSGLKSRSSTVDGDDSAASSPRPRSSKRDKISEGHESSNHSVNESEKDLEDMEKGDKELRSRPTSVVKFAPNLPTREKSTLSPSKSGFDDKRASRLSSMGQGSEIRAFSRDAIKERERIDREAQHDFVGFDTRYYEMIDELEIVDNTYEILVSAGRPKVSSDEKIQKVTVITDPNIAIKGAADESFPVDNEENGEKTSSTEIKKSSGSQSEVNMFPPKASAPQSEVNMFPPKASAPQSEVNMFPPKESASQSEVNTSPPKTSPPSSPTPPENDANISEEKISTVE